jgi:hypothetical protein
MSNNRFEALRKEDFSTSPEEKRQNPELQAAYQDKLNTLTHVFRGFLRQEKGVSWPQADLAAAEILELLLSEWEDPFTEEPDQADQADQEEAAVDSDGMLIRNLCPDYDILDDYFVEKLYDLDMQEYRARALWTNLFHWLEMLVRLDLVDQAAVQAIRAAWQPVLQEMAVEFGKLLYDSFPPPTSAKNA